MKCAQSLLARDQTTGDLVAQARVWVFADCYGITDLNDISLFKLHRELCDFPVDNRSVKKVIELVDYVYANTSDVEKVEELALRDLVIKYIICYADDLIRRTDFLELLRRGGHLASDFVTAVTALQRKG